MKKGIIALDIDGTITAEHHQLPAAVGNYFSKLTASGWLLIFITGRTFQWGIEVLKTLDFPYYFAVQNGAIILEMPSQKIVSKKYLDRSIFDTMDLICCNELSDYVVYGGYEYGDQCYFRPKRFSAEMLNYVEHRVNTLKEIWSPLESYQEMPINTFASIKCFGKYPDAMRLAQKIETQLDLHVPLIRDPFNGNYFVVQATHPRISKGQAFKDIISMAGHQGLIIAAGDDLNDLSMLKLADIKVVMANAPEELLKLADVIAPPATEEGIIEGLQQAIQGL